MKNSGIMVSVVCDVYNHEPYLRQCLDGFVIQKTNFKIEVLVHDDASTDKSAEIIMEYTNKYPDIFKPILQQENQYSRGVGIWKTYQFPRVAGKYVAICEGDDYWIDPYKLQKQVDFLESHPDFDMVRTDSNVYYQDTNITINSVFGKKLFPNCEDTFVDYVVRPAWLATCSWLIRSPLGDYDNLPNDCFKGDLALMIYIAKRSKVKYLPEVTSVYRVLKTSASHFSDSADNIRFWKSQVNTRCYYSCYLSLFDKIVLTKNILSAGRHFYINRRTFDIRSFLYLSMDIISRVFLQNK